MTFSDLILPFEGELDAVDYFTPGSQLPAGGDMAWPPLLFSPVAESQLRWSAWWSGDSAELERAYSLANGANSPTARAWSSTTGEAGSGHRRLNPLGILRRWFNGVPPSEGERRTNYHVPIAGDITGTSAALLFGQPPSLKCPSGSAGTGTQEYLSGLIDDGTHAKLMEAAEYAAALGGVYLRVVWDTDIAGKPWIDKVPADCAVPEFRYGKLTGVTFWSVIRDEGKEVVRHLEKHLPGQGAILHGVYKGSQNQLGIPMSLADFEETRPFAAALTQGNAITFPGAPDDASTVVYVPNMLPNRIWRGVGPQGEALGRSDFSGIENMMDGLDETLSSWMRDIRLGKARLIVPPSQLQSMGRGQGAYLDLEREVTVSVSSLVTGEAPVRDQILPQQFDIRWQAHQQTFNTLVETIVNKAGYSGQTLGLQGDIAQTATEVVARERKSLTTRGRKINYWRPALADIIYGLMAIDATVFGSGVEPVRPDVEWPDAVLPDQLELAQTVAAMRGAEAASVETGVAMLHPDWPTEKVAEEVARIYAEINIDLLSRARIAIGGAPGESVAEDLEQIPAAIGSTDIAAQVEADANGDQSEEG